ncbi:zinc finger protein ZAT5-like [Glycine soja]|uniref:Zinc finger protein ZAT5 n=1 Tax=Glycine soja TaxID=3848 RepID=A0A445F7D6_GLYSO|nr:zinc finger protein ZAT5-like [Glycine soja]KHN00957.1 Zinc finger protein ZAT5 [Glycine soja]RZB44746.1 Zinc finger protein ZAT5 [Glycine soja]
MEAPEELSLGGSKDHTNIVKGKRTKRVRPQSPMPFSITSNSSTGEGEKEEGCNNGDDDNNNMKNEDINNINSSPTSSAGLQDSTDEEEDMANCLILLAQGQSRESPKHAEEDAGMNSAKYSSRKFLEAATLGSSRAGYYVYECKTCNRTYPSFQALGGHRASHKKPKALMAIGLEKKQQHLLSSDEEEFQLKTNKSPFSLQLNTKGNLYSNNNKSKVHECSICGAEFTSGQALGGHMRRHRAPVGTTTPATLSFTPLALEPEEDHPRKKRNVLNLDLDLNLPAPGDDHRESKFAFASKQQQQQHQQPQQQQQPQTSLVFPAPALVDCHY